MKKISLCCAIVALGTASVFADVLYWQVANTVDYKDWGTPSGTKSVGTDYVYARVVGGELNYDLAGPNNTSIKVAPLGADLSGAGTIIDLRETGSAILTADIGTYGSTYSFWVELYSLNGDWLGRSEAVYGAPLSSYVHEPTSFTPADMNIMTVTAIHNIPEPTSGLLMLIGAGLLGLRRRKVA